MKILLNQTKRNAITFDLAYVKIFVFIRYMLIEIILLKIHGAYSKKDAGRILIVDEELELSSYSLLIRACVS